MKTVIHIVDEKVVRQEVPDDWIQCSVLGEYRPPEEFRSEGELHQSRTNCTRAFLMPLKEWDHHKAVAEKLKKHLTAEIEKLHHEQLETTVGVSVDDMIARLMDIKQKNPNARIVVACDGCIDNPDVRPMDGFRNVFVVE